VDTRVKNEIEGVGWGFLWWWLAVLLHLAVIALVVFWEPLRAWYLRQPDPEHNLAALEGDRMRQIVRELIQVHTRRIRERLQEQHKLLAELQHMRDHRHAGYAREAGPDAEPLSALGPPGPPLARPLETLDIHQLYELAARIEAHAYQTYRQLRIIELARIQGLSFAEAGDVTRVAIPSHPPINHAVFEQQITNATDGRLQALKNELYMVHAEVNAMIAAMVRMLDVARGLMGEDIGGVTVVGAGGVFEGSGTGRWGSDVGPALAPEELFPGNRDGDFGEDWQPVAGRKLMDDGRRGDWMFIDTWYIIGPFPNPNREYMDKVFPPESVVDLDATYVGKDGRNLAWQWMKSPRVMIAPHIATGYAVWYAYTEVYSDRNQTRWAAFGSDDYSKLWLNGELVWTSGKTPHKWIPDRGFRKLNLRAGHNQLLLKLENAGGTTGFSVVLYTGDIAATPGTGQTE
jgi:hypothetical protein